MSLTRTKFTPSKGVRFPVRLQSWGWACCSCITINAWPYNPLWHMAGSRESSRTTSTPAVRALEEAWFEHSINYDFRVVDPSGYIWGLPVIVPTCPKKLFSQGPRHKYVDIVTDTIHASSSDLITWNTLVMIKLKWVSIIPRQWLEITTQSLEALKLRDEKSPFLPDNRRGFARVTPVALSKVGVPDTEIHAMDEFPLHGLDYMMTLSHGVDTMDMCGLTGPLDSFRGMSQEFTPTSAFFSMWFANFRVNQPSFRLDSREKGWQKCAREKRLRERSPYNFAKQPFNMLAETLRTVARAHRPLHKYLLSQPVFAVPHLSLHTEVLRSCIQSMKGSTGSNKTWDLCTKGGFVCTPRQNTTKHGGSGIQQQKPRQIWRPADSEKQPTGATGQQQLRKPWSHKPYRVLGWNRNRQPGKGSKKLFLVKFLTKCLFL